MLYIVPLLVITAANSVFAAPTDQITIQLADGVLNQTYLTPFIVGGGNAPIENHSHLVSLLVDFGGPGYNLCGGTIINCYWIVTAAHCLIDPPNVVQAVIVRAGSNYFDKGGYAQYAELFKTNGYNPSLFTNDIALLKVRTSMCSTSSIAIKPISLPSQGSTPPEGKLAIIAGWGTLFEGGSLPAQLQSAKVNIISAATCRKSYGPIVTDDMICAGVPGGGIDSCQGDSGGPITVDNIFVGIVSFGAGCANANYPGVYTNTGSYRNWIDTNAK